MIDASGKLYAKLQALCYGMHYSFFDTGDMNVNIIALRILPGKVNEFDDYITLSYKQDKSHITNYYRCTTDPGLFYLQNPMNKNGTAVIAPQQTKGAFTFGKHRGIYECLVQAKPIKIYRDTNRDAIINYDNLQFGGSALQIHRASVSNNTFTVGKYSAGCIVIRDPQNFDEFMSTLHKSAALYGDKFTFTLFELQESSMRVLLDRDIE